MKTLILVLALALLQGNAGVAATPLAPLPGFTKGVNLASWIGNAFRQPIYDRDMAMIQAAGFDHVRIVFNPEHYGLTLTDTTKDASATDFSALDAAVAMARRNRLNVIIDVHTDEPFKQTLEKNAWAEPLFIDLWSRLTKRYHAYPDKAVAFELFNEPAYYRSPDTYNDLMRRTVAAIRPNAPRNTILVEAPAGLKSWMDGLDHLQPIDDPGIVYVFHFYDPYIVTHQGVRSGFEKKQIRYFHHLPYPSSKVDPQHIELSAGADKSEAAAEVQEYISPGWNLQRIDDDVARAVDWANKNHVRLQMTEFGANRTGTDPASRYAWIKDARTTFEKYGIGWDLWDYTDTMGIVRMIGETRKDPSDDSLRFVHPEQGRRVFDAEAYDALGLRKLTNP